MKRQFLIFIMTALFFLAGMSTLTAQDQPAPKKDTVNIDTDAKPSFYYAEEDEQADKGSSGTTIGIIGGVLVVAGAAFFLLKKKK